jgi:hypothetical protein
LTHQLSCFESSFLLSVLNSFLIPSSSSMPRLLVYLKFYHFEW